MQFRTAHSLPSLTTLYGYVAMSESPDSACLSSVNVHAACQLSLVAFSGTRTAVARTAWSCQTARCCAAGGPLKKEKNPIAPISPSVWQSL